MRYRRTEFTDRVTIRIGYDLRKMLEKYAEEKGMNLSEALRHILEDYFYGYKRGLDDFIAAKVIANETLFLRIIKAKLTITPDIAVIVKEILKEFEISERKL